MIGALYRDTFRGILPGDSVRYRTPQGAERTGPALRLLVFPTHVVVRDRKARMPVVVSDSNYISHRKRRQAPGA